MALFINVDPVAPRWYRRKVYRGWQFGYSGGTKNDFMMDIEVAFWRFVCYIGFKYPMNPSPRQERHEQWRKEQERARERANNPGSAFKRFWRSIRTAQASPNRMDTQRPQDNKALAYARKFMGSKLFIRHVIAKIDRHHEGGRELAARPGIPGGLFRDAAAPIEGKLLHEEHQRTAPDHAHHQNPEGIGLPKEPNA